jgi:hypothetical protein
LVLRDEFIEQSFESISQDFLDDIVNDITQTNKPEMIHQRSPQFLRNKSNEGVILLL